MANRTTTDFQHHYLLCQWYLWFLISFLCLVCIPILNLCKGILESNQVCLKTNISQMKELNQVWLQTVVGNNEESIINMSTGNWINSTQFNVLRMMILMIFKDAVFTPNLHFYKKNSYYNLQFFFDKCEAGIVINRLYSSRGLLACCVASIKYFCVGNSSKQWKCENLAEFYNFPG